MFGVMFCMAGIVILLMTINKNQAWYMRYIEVALGLLCIALGIMIPSRFEISGMAGNG